MTLTLVIARVVLAVVFLVAGVAKLFDRAGSRQALVDFGIPALLASPGGVLLPLAELVVALLLLPIATAWWGALGALALLLLFVVGIGYNLARGRTPDCHCFGQLHSAPAGWPTLLRNGLLGAVAACVVWQGPSHSGPSLVGWLSALTPIQTFGFVGGFVLLGLLAGQSWLLLNLLGQNGRLLLRIEALESRLGIESVNSAVIEPPVGLTVGTSAPDFQLTSLVDETLTLDTLRTRGKPVMLVFSDAGCGPCTALLPDLARWQREHHDALTIAIISRGTRVANQAKIDGLGLINVLLQQDREIAKAYDIKGTPSAVLVRPDGNIGSPLALGAGAIAALVDRAIQGVDDTVDREEDDAESDYLGPLPIGAIAPQFTLPDLGGKNVDLADLHDRPTLLIFWDPDCGFCQNMLTNLQAWLAHPPKSAPQVVIVSRGSVANNQAMGLHALVVLDEGFRVGRMFGATGTPMAVLIDAQGHIASPVRAGAPAVLALANTPQQLQLLPA